MFKNDAYTPTIKKKQEAGSIMVCQMKRSFQPLREIDKFSLGTESHNFGVTTKKTYFSDCDPSSLRRWGHLKLGLCRWKYGNRQSFRYASLRHHRTLKYPELGTDADWKQVQTEQDQSDIALWSTPFCTNCDFWILLKGSPMYSMIQ